MKLLKPLGLDYHLKSDDTMLTVAKSLAQGMMGVQLQKLMNQTANDSLWWMTHPCMFTMPFVEGAGSDMDATNPAICVGQLEFLVKSARNLPPGEWGTSNPYHLRPFSDATVMLH